MEITTGGECVLNLPLCPSFWTIAPPAQIPKITVKPSLYSSKMVINWSGFNLTNITGTRTINVKSTVTLDMFTALKAKRITEQPFDSHILITHHSLYQPLPYIGICIVDALFCSIGA